jgi:hypothetical protein
LLPGKPFSFIRHKRIPAAYRLLIDCHTVLQIAKPKLICIIIKESTEILACFDKNPEHENFEYQGRVYYVIVHACKIINYYISAVFFRNNKILV